MRTPIAPSSPSSAPAAVSAAQHGLKNRADWGRIVTARSKLRRLIRCSDERGLAMPQETKAFSNVEEVREFAAARGKFLVLNPDTLQQIEDAEARGGFEGGFTGGADGAPISGVGSRGPDSSQASQPSPDNGSMVPGVSVRRPRHVAASCPRRRRY
jgi:hypothetical protein